MVVHPTRSYIEPPGHRLARYLGASREFIQRAARGGSNRLFGHQERRGEGVRFAFQIPFRLFGYVGAAAHDRRERGAALVALAYPVPELVGEGQVFFGIITRQAIRRGSFENVQQLVAAIRAYIDAYNNRCQPFIWTKTADEILTHTTRQPTSDARH